MMTSETPYRVSPRFQKMVQIEKFAELLRTPKIFYFEFSGERARSVAMTIEQELFHLQEHQAQILRRESELVYILEDMWLDEQLSQIKAEIHVLMSRPESDRSLDDMEKEEELTQLLIALVDQRDKMLMDLDIERLREREEACELKHEYKIKKDYWTESSEDIQSTDYAAKSPGPVYHSLRGLITSQEQMENRQSGRSLDEPGCSESTSSSMFRSLSALWQTSLEMKIFRLPQFKAIIGDYAAENCTIS